MKYHFIQASSNRKTGPIPQTYTSRESCPPSCAHYRADRRQIIGFRAHGTKAKQADRLARRVIPITAA